VRDRPFLQRAQRLAQGAARLGERVLDADRDFGVDGAAHEPVPFKGADVVVGALAPRGPLAGTFRDVYRTIARLADAAGAPLFVVGGYSSLRPAPGEDRFVTDLSHIPAELHDEIRAGAALIIEDLPATPATLDWVFVSPALRFGARMPGERLGRYRLGDDVAVQPEDGGAISAADYALGFVDLIEKGDHHRAQVNLGH
jgi:putative NADH-flavin reductase